jgi:hypothetical protein
MACLGTKAVFTVLLPFRDDMGHEKGRFSAALSQEGWFTSCAWAQRGGDR